MSIRIEVMLTYHREAPAFAPLLEARKRSYSNPAGLKNFLQRFSGILREWRMPSCANATPSAQSRGKDGCAFFDN